MTDPVTPEGYPGPVPDPEMAAIAAEMAAADLAPPPGGPVIVGDRPGPAWEQLPPETTWQGAR